MKENEKKVLIGDLTTGYHYVSLDEAIKYEEAEDNKARFDSAYIRGLFPKTSDLVRKHNLRITSCAIRNGININFTYNRRKFAHGFTNEGLKSINWNWEEIDGRLCGTICRYMYEIDAEKSIREPFQLLDEVTNYFRVNYNEYWKKNNEYFSKTKERLDAMYELNSKNKVKDIKVKDITVKKGVTTLVWSDGDVTMVSCGVEDDFDLEKGIAMAVAKKFLGTNKSKSNFNDEIHRLMDIAEAKYVKRQEKEAKKIAKKVAADEFMNPPKKQKYMTIKEFAERSGVSGETIRKQVNKGQFPGAFKENGKWMIPVN